MLKASFIAATVTLIMVSIAAWFTHVITLLIRIFDGTGDVVTNAIVLVAGAFIAPVAVVHGILIWLGLA